MNIVRGRGNRRRSFEFPCATIVNRSPAHEQKAALTLLCEYLNIDKEMPAPEPILEGAA